MNDTAPWNECLRFWFEETSPKQRFAKDPEFDALIRERFGELHAHAVAGDLADWRNTPEGRLAEIIILDQFSRNMYRGTPAAFAQDDMALTLAQEAVRVGADKALTPQQRVFLYMPYMHSESESVQEKSVALFEALGIEDNLRFAKAHKEIIDHFGRFPHRNEILGRPSRPDELAFLDTPGSSF
ncbi:MAG: DUF924 family protein [Lautropia sp.]|nr:DUF924 family protein [Lautropia sp.]